MSDVLVAGAGIAGSAVALLLGRAGVRVTLFERHRFPREKACAEGLMPAGVAVLARLGLAEAIGGAPFAGVRYDGFGVRLEARFPPDGPSPCGLGQRRLRLDACLFAAARALPTVSAHEGTRVDGPLVERGRVAGLVVDGAAIRAPLVVAADGPRSVLRRKCGLDGRPRGRPRLGLRAHYRLAAGAPVPTHVEVFVGPGHELYLTPLPDGEVSLAALTEAGALGGGAARALHRLVAVHPALVARLDGATQASEIAGQMPLESRARRGVAPGLVLLGDAAGFVDPVTGSGMAQALLSAELLAAQLVADGRLEPSPAVLYRFERRRRALLRDTVLLARLVRALARRPALAAGTLRLLARAPGLYRHLVAVAGGVRPLAPAPFRARGGTPPALPSP